MEACVVDHEYCSYVKHVSIYNLNILEKGRGDKLWIFQFSTITVFAMVALFACLVEYLIQA